VTSGWQAIALPHERPISTLRTIITWARYIELFEDNSTRKIIYNYEVGQLSRQEGWASFVSPSGFQKYLKRVI
jgi:hypothetical protein